MKHSIFKYLLFCNFLSNFASGLFSPLFAVFVIQVTGEVSQAAWAAGVFMFLAGIFIIIFGRLIDGKYNRHLMLVIGYFLLALTSLYFVFVHDMLSLYIGQIINALAIGIIYPCWKTVYAAVEDKGHEGFEWGLFDGGNEIFFAISAFLVGFLIRFTTFHVLFLIMFVVDIIAACSSVQILRLSFLPQDVMTGPELEMAVTGEVVG